MNTHLVKTGILTYADIARLMADAPRRRFGITADPGFSVWATDEKFTVDPARFLTMGRATPFEGERVFGRCKMTMVGGEMVWKQ